MEVQNRITSKNYTATMVGSLDQFYKDHPNEVYASTGDDLFITEHVHKGDTLYCIANNNTPLVTFDRSDEAIKYFNSLIYKK